MNTGFTADHPTRIHFGLGVLDRTGEYAYGLGRHALLLLGRSSMQRIGIADSVKASLKASGISVTLYEGIPSDPDLSDVEMAIDVGAQADVDFVVALGGGSTMDAGKAVAASLGCGYGIRDLFYKKEETFVSQATLPIIAIPSTSGTGSELSMGAILSDRQGMKKDGLRSPHIIPSVAIVDPALPAYLPAFYTAVSGFDACAHAIETYMSEASNMITRMHSEHALKLIGTYLERAVSDGKDLEARTQMAFASMLMGYNLANASTCLPHRLQYPLSLHSDCSHGMGLATVYPGWLELTASKNPDRLAEVVQFWSNGKSNRWQHIRDWIVNLGIRKNIREWGGDEILCKQMAKEVSGNLALDPSYKGDSSILDMYVYALD